MISQEEFNGRAVEISISANLTVNQLRAKLWSVTATAGSLQVRLEDATKLKTGGPVFYIANVGSTTFTLADSAGTAITMSDGTTTLEQDTIALCLLSDNSTAAGTWYAKKDSIGVIANSGPSEIIYLVGGLSDTDKTLEYDHQLDVWTSKTNAPNDKRQTHGMQIGTSGVFAGNVTTAPLDATDEYDPDTWTSKLDMLQNSSNGQSSSGDGKGYILGFIGDRDKTDEYNLAGNTWTNRADKTTDCFDGGADGTFVDDIFVINGQNASGVRVQTVERYKPSTNAWSGRTSYPSPGLEEFGTFEAGSGNTIYKVGGDDGSGSRDDVDEYNISGDAWVSKLAYPSSGSPVGNQTGGAAGPEGNGYFMGGFNGGARDDNHSYNEVTDTWTAVTDVTGGTTRLNGQSTVPIRP